MSIHNSKFIIHNYLGYTSSNSEWRGGLKSILSKLKSFDNAQDDKATVRNSSVYQNTIKE